MQDQQNTNRRALILLFMTMFIVMLGFGVILPILPYYAESMGASATALGLLFATYSIIQFFFSPIWGQISDRVGRKPPMIAGLIGFAISFAMFGFATELWMLFAARILAVCYPRQRCPQSWPILPIPRTSGIAAPALGMLGASMGMGGDVWTGHRRLPWRVHEQLPFFFAAVLGLLVAIAVYFVLPESHSEEARAAIDTSQRPSLGLRNVFSALLGPLGFILIMAFLASFASANLEATFALFTEPVLVSERANWGWFLAPWG